MRIQLLFFFGGGGGGGGGRGAQTRCIIRDGQVGMMFYIRWCSRFKESDFLLGDFYLAAGQMKKR